MKFGTIVLTGILLNALPKMIGTIKKVFESISGFFGRVFNFFKPFISFVSGIEFDEKDNQNKKLVDDAENLKKQLKPLNDITNQVGKLTSDFDKAAEKSGASTGGGGSGGSETGAETTTTTVTTETTDEGADTTITPSDTTSEIQSIKIDYREKLDDALIKRAEYIESGDTSKLKGIDKKIEFYQKKIGIDPNSKFTILVKDSDGKVQKIDGSQLKAKTDNTISMLNNGNNNGGTTIVYQRQVVQTNIAVPV